MTEKNDMVEVEERFENGVLVSRTVNGVKLFAIGVTYINTYEIPFEEAIKIYGKKIFNKE